MSALPTCLSTISCRRLPAFQETSFAFACSPYSARVPRRVHVFSPLVALTHTGHHVHKLSRLAHPKKQWNINGAILVTDRDRYYYVDPALQVENDKCLGMIERGEFVMITGARASGKTTRVERLKSQLREEYLCLSYVTLNNKLVGFLLISSFQIPSL
jgi:hypothetical protein